MQENVIKIKELDLNLIYPCENTSRSKTQGGHKIVIIGKPGTGKTTLITSILYSKKTCYSIRVGGKRVGRFERVL